MLLDRAELEEMIEQDASQEVVCDFCGQPYDVAASEMAALLQHTERA
jgi:redox-regulated HSP33 family molecular chaperone